jgi:hypothetical protein
VTAVPVHTARVTVVNTTNTWSSVPSVAGTEGVAITWKVAKSSTDSPNTASITLHNLNDKSVASICDMVRTPITWTPAQLIELMLAGASEEPTEITHSNLGIASVTLEVGNVGEPLFVWYTGQSTQIETDRDNPDTTLTLVCADHGDGVGAGQIFPPKTYAAGTATVAVIVDLIHAMGLGVDRSRLETEITAGAARLGKVVTSVNKLLVPYTSAGSARAQLDQFFGGLDLTWMVLDGQFYVLGYDQVLPGYEPIVFKPSDGTLLRSPRRITGGALEVDTVLRPGLIPGRAGIVQASGLGNTSYRLRALDSQGSTETGASVRCELAQIQTIPGVF